MNNDVHPINRPPAWGQDDGLLEGAARSARRRRKIAGFLSPPILNGEGHKTGIEMVDLTTGQRQKFAQVACSDETPTVGNYRVAEGATEWARGVLAALADG